MPLTLEEAAKFHGHLGPFLYLGYIAGQVAVEKIGSLKKIEARLPLHTPFSCILDGLQCSTGCTYGKRSICAQEFNRIEILFESISGRKLLISISEEIVRELLSLLRFKKMEDALEWIKSKSFDEIFEVQEL